TNRNDELHGESQEQLPWQRGALPLRGGLRPGPGRPMAPEGVPDLQILRGIPRADSHTRVLMLMANPDVSGVGRRLRELAGTRRTEGGGQPLTHGEVAHRYLF